MSDQELIAELTAQARYLEEKAGQANVFLTREYEVLTRAARRIEQLTLKPAPPAPVGGAKSGY